ncbi:hypothetical protein FB451DRAFT_1556543 [Mycena latifolia]|nr:hypothetical protein FB451DRAFT_1556543 [Mycena latifolia]
MSILINGASVESVSYSPLIARTTLSTALAGCFPPVRNSAYLITVVTGVFGNHSLSILCDISPHAATHIVLGREWGALLRDSLLANGVRVGDTFDAWTFLTSYQTSVGKSIRVPTNFSQIASELFPSYPHRSRSRDDF